VAPQHRVAGLQVAGRDNIFWFLRFWMIAFNDLVQIKEIMVEGDTALMQTVHHLRPRLLPFITIKVCGSHRLSLLWLWPRCVFVHLGPSTYICAVDLKHQVRCDSHGWACSDLPVVATLPFPRLLSLAQGEHTVVHIQGGEKGSKQQVVEPLLIFPGVPVTSDNLSAACGRLRALAEGTSEHMVLFQGQNVSPLAEVLSAPTLSF
jgi:hypothetical protein